MATASARRIVRWSLLYRTIKKRLRTMKEVTIINMKREIKELQIFCVALSRRLEKLEPSNNDKKE
jgi:hypothetical protein